MLRIKLDDRVMDIDNHEMATVIVDAQVCFTKGDLGSPEAVAALPNMRRLEAIEGTCVRYTQDTHPEDYLETTEGKKLPVVHGVRDTPGWALAVAGDRGPVFEKGAFGSRALADEIVRLVRDEGVRVVAFAGVCTDICVISCAIVALEAVRREAPYADVEFLVVADACAGLTPQTHAAALTVARSCQMRVVDMAAIEKIEG